MKCHIYNLPEDILKYIFDYVFDLLLVSGKHSKENNDRHIISRVCREWRACLFMAETQKTSHVEHSYSKPLYIHALSSYSYFTTSREEGQQDHWKLHDGLPCLVRTLGDEGISYDILRWVSCTKSLSHPCIAAVEKCIINDDHVSIVFENCKTTVQNLVYSTYNRTHSNSIGIPFTSSRLKHFMVQMLSAIAHAHSNFVSHGNIAPYRILVSEHESKEIFKLADWGFSPPRSALYSSEVPIKPSRAAPEISHDSNPVFGPKNDVWALGTIYVELAYGNRDAEVFPAVQSFSWLNWPVYASLRSKIGQDGIDFVRELLTLDHRKRISAADALCHPYLCHIPQVLALKRREIEDDRITDVFTMHTDINSKMWSILVEWMWEVSYKFKLYTRTVELSIEILHRLLSTQKHLARKWLQLIGLCSLVLASKHEEVMIPHMGDFIYICDHAYTSEQLKNCEMNCISILDFQINFDTMSDYMYEFPQSQAAEALVYQDTFGAWGLFKAILAVVTINYSAYSHGHRAISFAIKCILMLNKVPCMSTFKIGKMSQTQLQCIVDIANHLVNFKSNNKALKHYCIMQPWQEVAKLVTGTSRKMKSNTPQRVYVLKYLGICTLERIRKK